MITVNLRWFDEFNGYGIPKSVINQLTAAGKIADIRLPENLRDQTKTNQPTIGFLLGEDKAADGTECYSIGTSYVQSLIAAKADIKFLDYDNTAQQIKFCDGLVLPGGRFTNPESFYIDGKNLGEHEGKRFFAYQSVIRKAYLAKKPMLGICAGAQMIGAMLGNMKMYRNLEQDAPLSITHRPKTENTEVFHQLKLIANTPIFNILGLPRNEDTILINSRHSQSMVHPNLQKYVKGKPKVKMDIYAIAADDGVPEIWGNEQAGILCVQGHPEDLAATGNNNMLNIYKHIVTLAARYKQTRQGD